MVYREGRTFGKRRRRDPKKRQRMIPFFIDFSSIFPPKIDPGTLPRTNLRKNTETGRKILVFWGSGEIFGPPDVSSRFFLARKSHFLRVRKAIEKKVEKKSRELASGLCWLDPLHPAPQIKTFSLSASWTWTANCWADSCARLPFCSFLRWYVHLCVCVRSYVRLLIRFKFVRSFVGWFVCFLLCVCVFVYSSARAYARL